MFHPRATRPTLLALLLAVGMTLAPLPRLEARQLAPRRGTTVQPRQEEEPRSLLGVLWSWLSAVWGKDGAHIDPLG